MPLAVTNYGAVLRWMEAVVETGSQATLSAAAVNLVMAARERREVAEAVRALTLVVPDGQPLVWALHLLGHHAARRIYGPDLMAAFLARAARRGFPTFLYGGRSAEALVLLERRLRERFPGLPLVGSYAPPFRPLRPAEQEEVSERINASKAAVVWVGIGQPKQELWMAKLRPTLTPPLLCGVGAAFDFHAGLVRQAPRWLGEHGLEWAWRLAQEPGRLWPRYARYNPRFIAAFSRQYWQRRATD